MKTYLILLLVFFPGLLVAQQSVVDSLIHLADSLRTNKKFSDARTIANFALEKAEKKTVYYKGMADAYMQMGRSYKDEGDPETAMTYYKKALVIRRDNLKDLIAAACTYNNMSSATDDAGNPEDAILYSLNAEKLLLANRSIKSDSLLAMFYNNRANIYEGLDSLDKAIETNRKALALFPSSRDTFTKITSEYGLAKRLILQNNFNGARARLDTALSFKPFIRNYRDSMILGQIYEALGVIELRKNKGSQTQEALKYFEEAKNYYLRFPEAKGALSNIYYNLGEAYETLGDLITAQENYKKAQEYAPDVSNIPEFSDIIQSRTEVIGAEITKQKNEQWLNLALFALILALAIIFTITLLLYRKEKDNSALKDQMYQLRHDIFKNFVERMNGLLDEESPMDNWDKLKYLISKLLTHLNFSKAYTSDSTNLKSFVRDMHMQAEIMSSIPVINGTYIDGLPDFTVSKTMREQLEAIVGEVFYNIKKYAFDSSASPKIVSISFEYEYDKGLILVMEDNGKGFDPEQVSKSGLRNIAQRAKGIKANLTIKSAPGNGTLIELIIPGFPESEA